MHKRNKSSLWFLLIISSSYMLAEIVGGLLSRSLALLADAGHMAIDAAAIALSLFAIWIAQKPPTHEKTYGYYRAEILVALVNGATLVAVSLWLMYEAWHRFSNPPEIKGTLMTFVAAGGLLVNLFSLFLIHGERKENLNIRGVWLHIVTDTLGSVSALAAALLVWQFGWNLADPIISFFISLLVLYGSWQLLSECVNVLLEGVPKGLSLAEIKQGIESLDAIQEVHDLHIWTVTNGVNALSAHVRLNEDMDHAAVLQAITSFLRDHYKIDHVTLQLEPPAFSHREMHF